MLYHAGPVLDPYWDPCCTVLYPYWTRTGPWERVTGPLETGSGPWEQFTDLGNGSVNGNLTINRGLTTDLTLERVLLDLGNGVFGPSERGYLGPWKRVIWDFPDRLTEV